MHDPSFIVKPLSKLVNKPLSIFHRNVGIISNDTGYIYCTKSDCKKNMIFFSEHCPIYDFKKAGNLYQTQKLGRRFPPEKARKYQYNYAMKNFKVLHMNILRNPIDVYVSMYYWCRWQYSSNFFFFIIFLKKIKY